MVKFTATASMFVPPTVYLLLLAPMAPGVLAAAFRQDGYSILSIKVHR